MLDRSGQPAGAAHERRPVSARRRRLLIVLSALLGWINHRFLKLPSTVALTMMGALASVVVIAVDRVLPQSDLAGIVGGFLEGIDFHETLMEGMLSFLLFAGALHVDIDQLQRGRWQIVLLSTIGGVVRRLNASRGPPPEIA